MGIPSFNSKLYSIVLIANIGGALYQILLNSYHSSYSNIIINGNESDTSFNTQTKFRLFQLFGTILGSLISSIISQKHGRKPALILEGSISVVASIMLVCDKNSWIIYIGSILCGAIKGVFFSVNTIYLAEIAEISNRGILVVSMMVYVNLGDILYTILKGIDFSNRITIFTTIISIFFTISTFLMVPESPYYLGKRYLDEEVKTTLRNLRNREDVEGEYNDIMEYVHKRKRCFQQVLIISIFFGVFKIYPSDLKLFYSEYFWYKADLIFVILTIILTTLLIIFLIESYGRKRTFIISYASIYLFAIFLTIINFIQSMETNKYDQILDTIVNCYNIAITIGINVISWTFIGEVLQMESKDFGIFILNSVIVIVEFLSNYVFSYIVDFLGLRPTTLVFTFVFGNFAIYYVKKFLFETKGKSLKEIQVQFQ